MNGEPTVSTVEYGRHEGMWSWDVFVGGRLVAELTYEDGETTVRAATPDADVVQVHSRYARAGR